MRSLYILLDVRPVWSSQSEACRYRGVGVKCSLNKGVYVGKFIMSIPVQVHFILARVIYRPASDSLQSCCTCWWQVRCKRTHWAKERVKGSPCLTTGTTSRANRCSRGNGGRYTHARNLLITYYYYYFLQAEHTNDETSTFLLIMRSYTKHC